MAAITETPTAVDAPHSLLSRLIAELIGTFFLVLAVVGTAIFFAPSQGPLSVALAIGLVVLVGVYAFGPISGGHFNPAVTLGAAAAGRLRWRDVLPYMAAQILGGAIASTILLGLAAGADSRVLDQAFQGHFASNGFGAASPLGFNLITVLVAEVILTALFLYVILSVTHVRAAAGFAPLAIGFTLTIIHLIAIPIDNASVNPARSIASAIYGGGDSLAQLWVFIVAPLVGALIAGFTFKFLFDRKPTSFLAPLDLAGQGDAPAAAAAAPAAKAPAARAASGAAATKAPAAKAPAARKPAAPKN